MPHISGKPDFIPIIDYDGLVSGSEVERLSAAKALHKAFRDIGFIYLKGSCIVKEDVTRLFGHAHKFFALPIEDKVHCESSQGGAFRGWFNPERSSNNAASSDIKETFDMGPEREGAAQNKWPVHDPSFKPDMVQFFQSCHKIHLVLLNALGLAIGLNNGYFENYTQDMDHFFRVIHYPAKPRDLNASRVRAGVHTDYGTLTLLFNDENGGLQVRNPQGDFVDADPVADTCIVNVGDMLSRWFNDSLKSTEHRVVDPPAVDAEEGQLLPERYAIAFFAQPNKEATIAPLEICCDGKVPKYPPIKAGEHVLNRLAYLHKKGKNPESNWKDDMAIDVK